MPILLLLYLPSGTVFPQKIIIDSHLSISSEIVTNLLILPGLGDRVIVESPSPLFLNKWFIAGVLFFSLESSWNQAYAVYIVKSPRASIYINE